MCSTYRNWSNVTRIEENLGVQSTAPWNRRLSIKFATNKNGQQKFFKSKGIKSWHVFTFQWWRTRRKGAVPVIGCTPPKTIGWHLNESPFLKEKNIYMQTTNFQIFMWNFWGAFLIEPLKTHGKTIPTSIVLSVAQLGSNMFFFCGGEEKWVLLHFKAPGDKQ